MVPTVFVSHPASVLGCAKCVLLDSSSPCGGKLVGSVDGEVDICWPYFSFLGSAIPTCPSPKVDRPDIIDFSAA
jgi:hypothetical protein